MSMVWEGLKSAKGGKSDLSAVWLDVANAYGSIPHRLIFFALKRYGVPTKWIEIIEKYYSGIWSKCFSNSSPSSWHRHQRGIFTGCTISIILFLAGINVILEFALALETSFVKECNLGMKAFMDDLFLMSSSVETTQLLLTRCTEALMWAGMSFRAGKSRSMVISSGSILRICPFNVSNGQGAQKEFIPSIHSQPVKFLGREISESISDASVIERFITMYKDGLTLIDKSNHSGIHKLWIYQHLLVPRARWPIQIYEISLSTAQRLEQHTSVFIRKWLNVHSSLTNICLYSSSSPCPLPLKSLTSILKSAKVSGHLLLRDSTDPLVNSSVPKLKVGRWIVEDAVRQGEEKIEFERVLGYHQLNRAGLGSVKHSPLPAKNTHAYRKLVSDKVSDLEEEQHLAKAVQLSLQGNWTRWCNYIKNDLSWKHLLAMPSRLTTFVLGATFDTLNSPSNLRRWHITTEANCDLCSVKVCTTAHVLSGCKVALSQGRYTFRHDSILRVIGDSIADFLSNMSTVKSVYSLKTSFVKAGTRVKRAQKKPRIGIFHECDDWELNIDFESSMVFPPVIAVTSSRPDIVCYSLKKRMVVLIELTSPCEENFDDRHFDKVSRYHALCETIKKNGWRCYFFAIEVGARGYCAQNVRSCFIRLGFNNRRIKTLISDLSSTAIQCSFLIWMNRNCITWSSRLVGSTQINSRHLSNTSKEKPQTPINHSIHEAKAVTSQTSCNGSENSHEISGEEILHHRPGLINKGNTCYMNSILQSVSVLTSYCASIFDLNSTNDHLPLVSNFCRVMFLLKSSKNTIDPSYFLNAFSQHMTKSGRIDFQINSQQDAPEILEYLLDYFSSLSVNTKEILNLSVRTTKTCHCCQTTTFEDEPHSILKLSVARDLNKSIQSFTKQEVVQGVFCQLCNSYQTASLQCSFIASGEYLIIQLKRFDNKLVKDHTFVNCVGYTLKLPVSDEEITASKEYQLVASICHFGRYGSGHYNAHVFDPIRRGWLICNDKAVLPLGFWKVDNHYSYILFYKSVT